MDSFVNLHVHTDSSALDGLGTKEKRIKYVSETLQQPALAITDHGTMSGIYDFWHAAQKAKIKPILGVEAYMVEDIKKKVKGEHRYHLVLLAKNSEGYQNIMQMQLVGNRYGFYHKPRVDRSVVKNYSNGVICLTACPANDIQQALINNDIGQAKKHVEWYQQIFGDDFYLEFQPHYSKFLNPTVQKLYRFWKKIQIPAVITADAHYITQDQYEDHNKLLLVNTGGKVNKEGSFQFTEDNLYLHSREEMIAEGIKANLDKKHIEKWCDTTLEVADKVQVYDIKQPDYIVPPIPEFVGEDLDQILKEKCIQGLKNKKLLSDIYLNRLAYELKIIYNAGFSSYFLVMADIVNWAKSENIYVGPGRGSAAGSLISYALGITDVDPIVYDLQFERFLNPERLGGKVLKFLE